MQQLTWISFLIFFAWFTRFSTAWDENIDQFQQRWWDTYNFTGCHRYKVGLLNLQKALWHLESTEPFSANWQQSYQVSRNQWQTDHQHWQEKCREWDHAQVQYYEESNGQQETTPNWSFRPLPKGKY